MILGHTFPVGQPVNKVQIGVDSGNLAARLDVV